MKGIFITFEGGEGSGKSTQAKALFRYLKRRPGAGRGKRVLLTREPGGTLLADAIRRLLVVRSREETLPETELFLYTAARFQHLSRVIRPELDRGTIVLCDRFADATIAYQQYGRRLPPRVVKTCNALATGGLKPDITFFLDVPPETGLQRAHRRMGGRQRAEKKEDRFERESLAFHHRVRAGYRTLARKERHRIHLIDGTAPSAVVFEKILEVLRRHEIF